MKAILRRYATTRDGSAPASCRLRAGSAAPLIPVPGTKIPPKGERGRSGHSEDE